MMNGPGGVDISLTRQLTLFVGLIWKSLNHVHETMGKIELSSSTGLVIFSPSFILTFRKLKVRCLPVTKTKLFS